MNSVQLKLPLCLDCHKDKLRSAGKSHNSYVDDKMFATNPPGWQRFKFEWASPSNVLKFMQYYLVLNLHAAGFSQGKGFGLRGQDSVDPCCLFTSIQRPLFSCLHSLILWLKVTAQLKLLHWPRKYFPPPWHKPQQLVVSFQTLWFLMLYQKHLESVARAVVFHCIPTGISHRINVVQRYRPCAQKGLLLFASLNHYWLKSLMRSISH